MNVMTLAGRDEMDDDLDPNFDEATYLRAFPDIAEAVRRGTLDSGLAHFLKSGRHEGRLENPEYRTLLRAFTGPAAPQVVIDAMTVSVHGAVLMTGWTDDRFDPMTEVSLRIGPGKTQLWTAIPRLARPDVERTLETPDHHRHGFLLVAAPLARRDEPPIDPALANEPVFRFASGAERAIERAPAVATDADLRDLALATLPAAAAGQVDPEAIYAILDRHVGVQIAALNRLIADRAWTRHLVEHVGPSRARYLGSVITVWRGGIEPLLPRMTLTAACAGGAEYEHILVITDPAQFEPAWRAARMMEAAHGLGTTLILRPDGDPFGLGQDAAAGAARSGRLIFMDQTVLPRDPDWALLHTKLLEDAPRDQTRLMGGLLYHPDGGLAHGGYYFDHETVVKTCPAALPTLTRTIRANRHTHLSPVGPAPRPVAAVPSAFLSVERGWFEEIGGFVGQYANGAREDLDLGLRALSRGTPAWVHKLRFWWFERLAPARPEPVRGGAILNDWLFHRQWDETILSGPMGPEPSGPRKADK